MHRLGVVVGALTACVVLVRIVQAFGLRGVVDLISVVVTSVLAGALVWLVFLGIGWAIQGFQPRS